MNPLQEVWVRPRKVFREMSGAPLGAMDYLFSAAQGVATSLFMGRLQNWGLTEAPADSLFKAVVQGGIMGIVLVWFYSWLYTWIGRNSGGVATRTQIFHVLSYGSVPLAALLPAWCLFVLLLGRQAFVSHPMGPDTDMFVTILMGLQSGLTVLLALWSTVLQVMGMSEMHQVRTGAAFGTWLLGQFVGVLASAVIVLLVVGANGGLPKT